ncbi:geranylgeranyl pyrophosphate synthase [Actimicrobium sp. GrIS 1.19]|uniref:polyprenyl synthetase family protein n=1 Tax=Actimicrobium sp. GrIS 1.19 TaxID=3071708 RepID=UPI002E05A158|nr:geranylgeranyl pyrophosphate synthase [Actimicrobium sp. GrIS 1.19]
MSARLVMASTAPTWNTIDGLHSVEQRCRDLIQRKPAPDADIFNTAAGAATYHLHAGGSRIRARLALDAAFHLGLSARDAVAIASACELLHNASLVHDDLQDRDVQRRGADAVWKIYGEATAICTGDLLLSAAYAALADMDRSTCLQQMLSLVHARTAAAIRGQAADVSHRIRPILDVSTYLQIVAGKSGALLSLPLELALIAAGQGQWADKACEAAEAFAIGYQIADDLDDLEKDAGSEDVGQTLNLALLMRSGDAVHAGDGTVLQRCVTLAQHHLTVAAAGAAALPHESGRLLAELAIALNGRL